ncbi:ABC transporter ATP-binding protein [Desulfovirgula thermocuniculi]|uniref:ABC transporter ATP-binding protein n=1 Tax=Desulfovirgula thermocuniculi TaxID=348842 RepID=UPI00041548FD|nr:ABC transporter ATP-binding protein [Desulfovirgula thermocuniculi]
MILEVEDLHTYIGEFHILQGVSLKVPSGSVTVILGRNGAGKTTTLRSIMGLIPHRKGKITFEGRSIERLPAHRVAQLGVGYVPEDQGIFTCLTVEENLRLAMRNGTSGKLLEKVLDLFPDLRVALRKKAGNLSGGQRQMLALGRALVTGSRLLLVDEPSKGLAPVMVERVAGAISQIKKEITIVLVEQNFRLAKAVGDYYSIIDDGRTVVSGKMGELVENHELLERYLGVKQAAR